MTFSSQFSLSVELTRLLPLGSILGSGSQTILKLVEELQKSGSDIVLEEKLAVIFGRNRIDQNCESSFRTAVHQSSVSRLTAVLDIVLEGGAGPTVRRSLNDKKYLSSIIQLSLLSHVHELDSLTKALIKAVGQRNEGSNDIIDVPKYNTLLSTLNTIRDQTTNYRWDLIFSAVESNIHDSLQRHADIFVLRRLPFVVLQGLLDLFAAVQHFQEQRALHIRVSSGVSTLVVWAHHVLGMTVSVIKDSKVICQFGKGIEQVSIQWHDVESESECDTISLLRSSNSTEELVLSSNPYTDLPLVAACRHSARGFALKYLRSHGIYSSDHQTAIANTVTAVCIAEARIREEYFAQEERLPKLRDSVPSKHKIVWVAATLFNGLACSDTDVYRLSHDPVIQEAAHRGLELELMNSVTGELGRKTHDDWNARINDRDMKRFGLLTKEFEARLVIDRTTERILRVIIALCFIANVEECENFPIDIEGVDKVDKTYRKWGFFVPERSWKFLIALLGGSNSVNDRRMRSASTFSSAGWSLVLGTMQQGSPANTRTEISAYQGVPSRNQERRSWIVDLNEFGYLIPSHSSCGQYRAEHQRGERMKMASGITAKFHKTLISDSSEAFEVARYIQLKSKGRADDRTEYIHVGNRALQDLCWETILLPECVHPSTKGEVIEIPEGCVAFSGWRSPEISEEEEAKGFRRLIELAMTAGNEAAQWSVLFALTQEEAWQRWNKSPSIYLRSSDCCLSCAVESVQKDTRNFPKLIIL